jgi:dephospho-CoA kinase
MALVIGVTGGIASGKTTVANLFQQHFGVDIVDADLVAREVVTPNSAGLNAIVAHFGPDILLADGSLDRAKLRGIIFNQPDEKAWLDGVLHPMIRQEMQRALTKVSSPYALLVVPLLIENQLQSMVDRVLVIDVDPQIQIARTMQRDNVSREQAEQILAAQASRQQRLAMADDIINNQVSNDELLHMISNLNDKYLVLQGNNL